MSSSEGPHSDRLVGTLVHRLVHRFGLPPDAGGDRLAQMVESVIRPADAGDAMARGDAVVEAAQAYRRFCADERLQALYRSGTVLHEVPFTMVTGDEPLESGAGRRIVRGTIDCLVRAVVDGLERVTVIELKTGRPRPEHDVQTAWYRAAAHLIHPGADVQSALFYAGFPTNPE